MCGSLPFAYLFYSACLLFFLSWCSCPGETFPKVIFKKENAQRFKTTDQFCLTRSYLHSKRTVTFLTEYKSTTKLLQTKSQTPLEENSLKTGVSCVEIQRIVVTGRNSWSWLPQGLTAYGSWVLRLKAYATMPSQKQFLTSLATRHKLKKEDL